MAGNKLKAKKKASTPDELRQDEQERVDVKSLIRDERTHKITATALLLFAAILFIAYASYLFTWQEDQDKVLKYGIRYLIEEDLQAANLLGRVGAWLAHISIYMGVGVTAFLLCSVFFVAGVNLLFGRRVYSFVRTLKYTLAGIIVLPVAFSFFLKGHSFAWGGAYGNFAAAWLTGFMGTAGTAALLMVAAFAYLIWRFNPVLSRSKKDKKSKKRRST